MNDMSLDYKDINFKYSSESFKDVNVFNFYISISINFICINNYE